MAKAMHSARVAQEGRTLMCQIVMDAEGLSLMGLEGKADKGALLRTPLFAVDKGAQLPAQGTVPVTAPSPCEALAAILAQYASSECKNVRCRTHIRQSMQRKAAQRCSGQE
jgi:hypothetical protein